MKTHARGVVAAGLLCLGLSLGCAGEEGEQAPGEAAAERPRERPTPGVRVAIAEVGEVTRSEGFLGEVVALTRVELAPLESGQLRELRVDEGDRVEADAVVASLDDGVEARELGVATARTETARAAQRQAELQLQLAQRDGERISGLVAQGARPEADALAAADAIALAEQRLDAAERDVALQQASASLARARTARREVRAPFAALVAVRHVSEGAQVSPAAPIVTLVDVDSLRVRATFPEAALARLREGVRATAQLDGVPEAPVALALERVAPLVDAASRTVRADFVINELPEGASLREGMFARGSLELERSSEAVRVPAAALQEGRGAPTVWVVQDEVAAPVEVEVVLRNETEVALSGVEAGAMVIVSPIGRMEPDTRVIVVEEP